MGYLWVACLAALYFGGLSSVYAVCAQKGKTEDSGMHKGWTYERLASAWNLVLPACCALAAVAVLAQRSGDAFMLEYVVALLVWLFLLTLLALVTPLRLSRAVASEGPSRAIGRFAFHFFGLPIGGVASRITQLCAGHAATSLKDVHIEEQDALFSTEPATVSQREPLARVVQEFAATTAEDIMVPRSAMVAIPSSNTLEQCVDVFAATKFSRLPVYEGDTETVIGIVHVMDLLKESDLTRPVRDIVRPVLMVPESKPCDELLKEFERCRSYMALVLDEYGGTAGLVTVEDVLEELVGEMGQEPSLLRRLVHRIGRGVFIVSAQIEVEKLESVTGIRLRRGDYETLAGYLLQELQRIPEEGVKLKRDGVLYEIARADRKKIKLVKVCIQRPSQAGSRPSSASS